MKTFAPLSLMLLLLALPATVQAQWKCSTNNDKITITGYTGPGGVVTIPDTLDELPVVGIGTGAFYDGYTITKVAVGTNVTSIGKLAFGNCSGMTGITLPRSVTSIEGYAFMGCHALTNVSLSSRVTHVGYLAFSFCNSLRSIAVDAANPNYSSVNGVLFDKHQTTLIQYPGGMVAGSYAVPDTVTSIGLYAFCEARFIRVRIPASVTSIGDRAFKTCSGLTDIYCTGNPPAPGTLVFEAVANATAYYLPGAATNWTDTYGGIPAVLWDPQARSDASFGVHTNGFGFTITNAGNPVIVVEASTNLVNPAWITLSTNPLVSGSSPFHDGGWSNYPVRFYRFRSP